MKIADNWEQAKYKAYRFPLKVSGAAFDAARVHPYMQKTAVSINEHLKDDERVLAIVLFGGSTTIRCHPGSDADVVVRLRDEDINLKTKNEVSEAIQEASGWNADVLWYDEIPHEGQLFEHVLKGVQIL